MAGKLRRSPPFRAEHLGSLLRPEGLRPENKKQLDPAQLTAVEDQAISDIVKLQLDCGFRGVSDGEFR
jgi:methionine synthase II (cobalamin-independent)